MKKIFFIALCGFIIAGCSAEKDKSPEVVVKKEDPKKLIENLFVAVLDSDEQSVQALLENPNTDVNAYDDKGQTALMRAVQIDSSPYIVELLISSGAKIFQPRKDSPETALDDLNPSNVAMSKLFSKEKVRISKKLEEDILNESFAEATQFIQDNFLSYDFILNDSELSPLKLGLQKLSSNSEDGINFITQELGRYVGADEEISFVLEHGWPLATKISDAQFLETLLSALKSNSEISELSYLNADFEDINWLTQKINLVTKHGFKMPAGGSTEHFVKKLNMAQEQGLKDEFLQLNRALQKSLTDDYSKSLILQQVLLETEKSIKTSPDKVKWISLLINDWESGRKSIEATGYQFDDHTLNVLKGLEGKDIILS